MYGPPAMIRASRQCLRMNVTISQMFCSNTYIVPVSTTSS